MTSISARLLSPEEIAVRAGGEIPFLRLPERATAFGEREMRLRQLSSGHAMGEYLAFIAEVARAQGEVIAGNDAAEIVARTLALPDAPRTSQPHPACDAADSYGWYRTTANEACEPPAPDTPEHTTDPSACTATAHAESKPGVRSVLTLPSPPNVGSSAPSVR